MLNFLVARSRLYRSLFCEKIFALQHFFKLYKMYALLHSSKLIILGNLCETISDSGGISANICIHVPKSSKILKLGFEIRDKVFPRKHRNKCRHVSVGRNHKLALLASKFRGPPPAPPHLFLFLICLFFVFMFSFFLRLPH